MRAKRGVTLVELLIAITIFAIVMAIVTVGISSMLRTQGVNEAATSAQSKLRRVTEVFTQELRSAVLGGITNTPYQPGDQAISFMLLSGGAGYQVLPHGGFANRDFVEIVANEDAPADVGLAGGQVLLVNSNGAGVLFDVTTVTQAGGTGSGSAEFTINHPSCTNTIGYAGGTLLFQVQTLGFRYDTASGTLFQQLGNAGEVPVAFDLDTFRLDYVYTRDSDGQPVVRSSPRTDAHDAPLRETSIGGEPVTLARVQMVVGSDVARGGGATVNRTYSGLVDLPRTTSVTIKKVKACNAP
jgi:prepilin-type N-terminal cleavage/methylation domain-containing protein